MSEGMIGNQDIKGIIRLFLKTNKKRLTLTIIVSIIVFTLLSTFLLTWFNFRYNSFTNTEASYDWYRDNRNSITFSVGLDEKLREPTFNFEFAVGEIHSKANEIASGMFEKYTASMYCLIDSVKFSPLNQSYSASFMTLQQEAYEFMTENLIDGRLPNNASELIYCSSNMSNPLYYLGEQVGLQIISDDIPYTQNFTIVGIINNLANSLHLEGYSNDIFNGINDYDSGYEQFNLDLFLTNSPDFVEIISFYPSNSIQKLTLNVDFNYQFSIEDIRNLKEITNKIAFVQSSILEFEHLPPKNHLFCSDLEFFIFDFQFNWNYQTVKIIALGIPAIILFSFVSIEIFNIGNFKKSAQFKLFKLYGLEFKSIRKIFFVENLIISSSGMFFGIILGTIFGYFFTLGMGTTSFGFYLNAFLEPVVFVTIFVFSTMIFIGGFIIEVKFAKRIAQLTSEIYKSKRIKPLRKFFTSIETILILIGAITIGIGFAGWYICLANSLIFSYAILSLELVFMFFMVVGGSLIFVSIFLIISRLVMLLWRFIGNQVWKKRKNYFTLALKQLSIYSKDFQRVILVMFLICLCVVPGLILIKSTDDHLEIEANLAMGFSDLMIQGWNGNDFQILENISSINGVELCTAVEVITLRDLSNIRASNNNDRVFDVDILNIYNISEFVAITSSHFPNKMDYSLEDISQLESNMTYMMSSKFAHNEKYDCGKIYSSSKITDPLEESYDMIFVNKFECFPLLPYKPYNYFISLKEENYNLVMSNLTASQIKGKLDSFISVNYDYYLLVKISSTTNKTTIIESIENLPYSLKVVTYEEIFDSLQLGINKFSEGFLVVITIISSFMLLLFGFLTARNIATQRLRIIDSDYQVGAKNYQIWGNFSIEFFLVIFIPLSISMLIASILLYDVFSFLLDIPQIFKEFVPWLPVWLMGLILLFCIAATFCGWLLEMINRVNRFKPVRQE
ncbi:MAG: FtsX-like permease family protein [Candidatus Heimdallarchaeota archaeon]